MREFFRGWRRKVGCMALAMACVLTVGWVRSFGKEEGIHVTDMDKGRTLWLFVSRQQSICVTRCIFPSQENVSLRNSTIGWHYGDSTEEPNLAYWTLANTPIPLVVTRHWGFGDFILGNNRDTTPMNLHDKWFVLAPYWSFVIPLTLLAAYLILWKPRKLKAPDQPPNSTDSRPIAK